jgi:hypothetical protein
MICFGITVLQHVGMTELVLMFMIILFFMSVFKFGFYTVIDVFYWVPLFKTYVISA